MSVWSGDQESAEAVGPRLQRGIVWINESPMISHLAPFGVVEQVGIGRLNGMEGLLGFTAPRTIIIRRTPAAAALPQRT